MRRLAPWMIAAAGVLWGLLGIFVRHLNARGLASMDLAASPRWTLCSSAR